MLGMIKNSPTSHDRFTKRSPNQLQMFIATLCQHNPLHPSVTRIGHAFNKSKRTETINQTSGATLIDQQMLTQI
jgi:hypothetical protein